MIERLNHKRATFGQFYIIKAINQFGFRRILTESVYYVSSVSSSIYLDIQLS